MRRVALACVMLAVAGMAPAANATPGALATASSDWSFTPGDHRAIRGIARAPLVMPVGSQLQFLNRDLLASHTLESFEVGPDGRPIFDSGVLQGNQLKPVLGTETLAPGDYRFRCFIHYNGTTPASSMEGVLTVVGP